MRMPVLFHCPRCGLVFEGAAITGFAKVTLFANAAKCPGCGSKAASIDGTFDFVGNAIRVLDAPPRTIVILSALQEALRKAEQNRPTAEVISEIEKTSPELAGAIQTKVSSSGKKILVGLLLALLSGCSMHTTLDLNALIDQVHVYATGADPYSTGSIQSQSQEAPKINRQQRRYKERQTKKQQRQTERRPQKKPKR